MSGVLSEGSGIDALGWLFLWRGTRQLALAQRQVEDLVTALLAVNSYPITRVWEILPGLREASLCEVEKVVAMDNEEVVKRLRSAGYDRGKVTQILAPRLRALMMKAQAGALDELSIAIENRDFELASRILLPVPGVGPRVVETAWLLLRQS